MYMVRVDEMEAESEAATGMCTLWRCNSMHADSKGKVALDA